MATEIELKLKLAPKAIKRLAAHPLLAATRPQKLHLLNTYYDTPDLDLHARRIALRFRKKNDQWLLTVKSAEPASGGLAVRNEWETQAEPGVFNFAHVDQPALRDLLDSKIEQLNAIFTTNFRRTLWHLPFGDSLIELAVDRGSIDSGGHTLPICEIELELLSGKIDDLFALARTLQEDFDLRPAVESKAERGYALFTGEPAHPYRASVPVLSAELHPVEAFRRIALSCLEHFQRNEAGILETSHPEYVHQARVALRRLRSAIKLFGPVLPHDFGNTYVQRWKVIASILGEARDWDVLLAETLPPMLTTFPEHRHILWLKHKGTLRAKQARQAAGKKMKDREHSMLLLQFTAALYSLPKSTAENLNDFACRQLEKQKGHLMNWGKKNRIPTPTQYHQLRIHIKNLRYAHDFFSALLPEESHQSRLANFVLLQNALGTINDLSTAVRLINKETEHKSPDIITGWLASRQQLLCKQFLGLLDRPL